ncbi:UDP-glycosyltransferase UGT5-like [Drosophila tropicalis]|uniref:UDP-glycosyltransferase UGT5-like n=1 Tax=Drosophila tropicalis TaxID=46794 RepID=UPI0035AB6EFB
MKEVLVLLLGLISISQSANILGIFTCPMPSHSIVQMSVAKALAENGHNVTILTTVDPVIKHKNFKVIHIPLSTEDARYFKELFGSLGKTDTDGVLGFFLRGAKYLKFSIAKMFDALKDPRVKDLYENKGNKFDLVICPYLTNNFQLGLAHKLKAPVISLTTLQPFEFLGSLVANPRELSYVPAMNVGVEKGAIMTLSQRLKTLAMSWGYRLWDAIENIENKKRYKFLYGDDPTMPPFEDLTTNISLMFFNSHALSEGPIRPNLPGVIEIGGIQIKDTPDPLPKNIAEFLDNAREGAILLSLGSNVQSDHLQSDVVRKLFNVFANLKLKVIWKWDKLEHIPGNSSNILYSKWLPQDDILAHPNIKLFITHAGRGGIAEASYHGKPMLALPMFGDQQGNAGSMVKQGFGLSLKLLELDEKTFHNTITEILQNPQYKENVENFSKLYRDRPLTARQSVLYWTEYVLRYQGAKHLQSPLVHMDFIAANNLDVYGILGISVVFVIYLIYLFTNIFCRKMKSIEKVKTN